MANINHFDFKNYRVFETEIAGRKLTVETGKMAQLANGSCLVRYGETAVLVIFHSTARPLFSLPLPHPLSRVTASTFSRSPLTLRSVCTQ